MNEEKTQELLLQLLKDMSYIKAKLDSMDEQRWGTRIDALEAQNREHDRIIKSLENRSNTMEKFTRDSITDAKKQQTSVFISMGLAVFGTLVSLFVSFLVK